MDFFAGCALSDNKLKDTKCFRHETRHSVKEMLTHMTKIRQAHAYEHIHLLFWYCLKNKSMILCDEE